MARFGWSPFLHAEAVQARSSRSCALISPRHIDKFWKYTEDIDNTTYFALHYLVRQKSDSTEQQ